MQAEAVHVVARNAHDLFCPVVIVGDARATGNAEHVVSAVIADVSLEAAVEVGIIGRAHIAAAAPVFIADTEVFHLPRLGMTVFGAQVRHGQMCIRDRRTVDRVRGVGGNVRECDMHDAVFVFRGGNREVRYAVVDLSLIHI